MALQHLGLCEGLATLGAQVGPLPRVLQQVDSQPLARVKGQVTVLALVGFYTRVLFAHVSHVLCVVSKPGPALWALEWCMDQGMLV